MNLFSVSESLEISGPKNYMAERFPLLKAEIQSGNSVVFNYAMQRNSGLQNALLVTISTDYNTWNGTKSLISKL